MPILWYVGQAHIAGAYEQQQRRQQAGNSSLRRQVWQATKQACTTRKHQGSGQVCTCPVAGGAVCIGKEVILFQGPVMVIAVLHRNVVCRQHFALVQSADSALCSKPHWPYGMPNSSLVAGSRKTAYRAQPIASPGSTLAGLTRQHAVKPSLHTSTLAGCHQHAEESSCTPAGLE